MITIFDMSNVARRYVEAGGSSGIRDLYWLVAGTPGVVIATWDGYNSKKLRKDLYPAYKERRVLPTEDISKGLSLVSELLNHSKAIQIRVAGYEADDVIAHLAGQYNHLKVRIHSTDADFAQLLMLDGVVLDRTEFAAPPSEMRLYKACVGDASDNIPGIKGFGKGLWAKLTEAHKEALMQLATGQAGHTCNVLGTLIDGVPQRICDWLADDTNLALFRTFWKIIGFFPVPQEVLNAGTTIGVPNPTLVTEICNKYLLAPMTLTGQAPQPVPA